MTEQQLYEIFLGMRLHFSNKNYDYVLYGPKKVSQASVDKYFTLLRFIKNKFQTKEALENRLIAIFKHKNCWLNEIVTPAAIKLEQEHNAAISNFSYNFENHLKMIKEAHPNIMDVFKTQHAYQVPPIVKMLLNKQINIETYCALDYLLDFSSHISDLIWKDEKFRIEKYKAFFKPNVAKIAKIAKPFFV